MAASSNNELWLERLDRWMRQPEGRLEFKEARSSYSFDHLREYCVAIANEGGGAIILGISDKMPRRVVGTNAFKSPEKLSRQLLEQFHLRFEIEEVTHPCGRVLIVNIPSHPIGSPLNLDGRYLMRSGESTVPMTPGRIAQLVAGGECDFTSLACPHATLQDLDVGAIEKFRFLLQGRSSNPLFGATSIPQLLEDHDLATDGKITYAALLLFGKHAAVSKLLPQAELIFEFRTDESQIRHQHRTEYRGGFLLWQEELWATINLRNEVQLVQEGFFNHSVATFNEEVIREAILNAVSHRDYQVAGSIFVRQFSRKLEVSSPGGLPQGITPENILQKQWPRNRRLAEAFQRCGLIERSGQGVDLMFNKSLREGKRKPDFTGTDASEVKLLLRGDVQNPQFVRFLEMIGTESGVNFATEDLIALDHVSRGEPVPDVYKNRLGTLIDEGIIERIGKGRGVRMLLSKRFYSFIGRPGGYTHRLGLDREANKALLEKHISRSGSGGAALQELQHVLPATSRAELKGLLRELRREGALVMTGTTRNARYYTEQSLWKLVP